ncbi:SRPBCC family protein [Aquimarina sp. 2201CG14-23]|uniref:SRPBCC family protein n=1 Tax=Aquimarina mycalae TaxID=3040073 RepID=UPI002477D3D1|nr:SRPBCC domain-containing protein [Aquimarina sp. 2201CG14-23]MDH7444372.1 SRPBCC domain-containing protein [Aquimarina sp. 2201CG14-23]
MEKLQWNSFTKKIYIHTSSEKLYNLWATQQGITSWFLKEADYVYATDKKRKNNEHIQKGDVYTWQWHNWDEKEKGKVLEANGRDYIEMEFGGCKVSIKLEEKQDITIVILTQFEIPEDDDSKLKLHYGCSNGWTFWLTNLKAFIEHGILLNEKEIDLRGNELAGYQFVNM